MELIMVKCAGCGQGYLTKYQSGDTECPMCKHVNKLLVGEDAANALLEQERKNKETQN